MAGSGGTSTTLPLRRVTTPVPVWYAKRCASLTASLSDRKTDAANSSPLKTGGWLPTPPWSVPLGSVTVHALFDEQRHRSGIVQDHPLVNSTHVVLTQVPQSSIEAPADHMIRHGMAPLPHPLRHPPHSILGAAKTQIHQYHPVPVAPPSIDAPQVAAACQSGLESKAAPLGSQTVDLGQHQPASCGFHTGTALKRRQPSSNEVGVDEVQTRYLATQVPHCKRGLSRTVRASNHEDLLVGHARTRYAARRGLPWPAPFVARRLGSDALRQGEE